MAALAKWGADISGSVVTTGSSTAYAVSSNSVFDSLTNMNGAMLAFVPHATNAGTSTINVDGLGAKPLRQSPGVELPAGTIILGTPYVCTYNNSDGAWYLQGFTINPYNVPIGGYLQFSGDTPPNSSFILPAGQAVSRTTYATYFALSGVGTRYGTGDGSTTFNVPDLRGRVMAALDNLNGSAASRITVAGGNFDGTVLGGTGGAQNHTLTQAELPAFKPAITVTDPGHTHVQNGRSFSQGHGSPANQGPDIDGVFDFSSGARNGTTGSNTNGITAALTSNLGSGNAHTILPPMMMVTTLLRII
jgi:microcystin-dependent protein